MDVLPLDSSTFYPTGIFEEYNTIIWTERCFDYGDFTIKSTSVQQTIDALPIGSFITLRDTTEVMMVETHDILTDKNGETSLTVSGRSLDSFLENRILVPPDMTSSEDWETAVSYTGHHFLSLLIWNALANNSGFDPTRMLGAKTIGSVQDPYLAVPNLVVSNTNIDDTVNKIYSLSKQTVSALVLDLQSQNKLGVRIIRPATRTRLPYQTITFDVSNPESYGKVQIEESTDDTKLRIDVYKGMDRSVNQSLVDPVVFYNKLGHISEPHILKSNKTEKNKVLVLSSDGYVSFPDDLSESFFGFKRRISLLDISKEKGEATQEEWDLFLQAEGLVDLAKNKSTLVADGKISDSNPYVYGKDYFLGDTITFAGNYEPYLSVYVNEVIRSQTSEGESTFPSVKQF